VIAPIDRRTRNAAGLTMVELLITIAAGSIVILGVYRLLTTTMWSYNLQSQMTDMYQNATYTIKELSEVLEQTGADLPNMYYQVILTANSTSNDIKTRVNKKNGKLTFNSDTTCDKIPVTPDSVGKAFVGADSLLVDTGGWSASVQITNVKTGLTTDTVVLAAATSFHKFNVAFGAATRRYFLNGTNFCIDSAPNVQAENIDSMSMTFLDTNHVATSDWSRMISASIYVRARTATPDPKYKCPGFGDGYHRLALNMAVRFRNRF
jgi:Tfp pilus assembly protein PilW